MLSLLAIVFLAAAIWRLTRDGFRPVSRTWFTVGWSLASCPGGSGGGRKATLIINSRQLRRVSQLCLTQGFPGFARCSLRIKTDGWASAQHLPGHVSGSACQRRHATVARGNCSMRDSSGRSRASPGRCPRRRRSFVVRPRAAHHGRMRPTRSSSRLLQGGSQRGPHRPLLGRMVGCAAGRAGEERPRVPVLRGCPVAVPRSCVPDLAQSSRPAACTPVPERACA